MDETGHTKCSVLPWHGIIRRNWSGTVSSSLIIVRILPAIMRPPSQPVSERTIKRYAERIARLYEHGADSVRIGQYVLRWVGYFSRFFQDRSASGCDDLNKLPDDDGLCYQTVKYGIVHSASKP